MQTKSLQMKRALRTALLVLLLGTVGMGKGYAQHYDFSAVCETGQTLYYIIDSENNSVCHLINPSSHGDWEGYQKPTGDLVIPEQAHGHIVRGMAGGYFNGVEYGPFSNCTELTSVVIPNTIPSIINGAFSGCTGLTSVTIPSSVSWIMRYAFSGCTRLTSVTIHASIETIDDGAFEGCTSLSEVSFNAVNCTQMGSSDAPVFKGCRALTRLTIGENVQTIPACAFKGCIGLTNITIPKAVTTIGSGAFEGCTNLVEVNFNAINCTQMGSSYRPVFKDCTDFSSLTIGEDVQTIPAFAFNGFKGTSIVIPRSVASIGGTAFGNCSRLTTVYYDAENATGSSAFPNCTNLTTIHIGANVREIHPVFGGCSSVHLVVALGPTPAVLDNNALTDIAGNSILMVSCGKRLTYYSVWNMFDFNNIIEDCGEYAISMNNVGAGGNITASPSQAQMGQTVTLTVTPNPGMVLSSISVANATDPTQIIPIIPVGKATSKFSFVMPPFSVSVAATFTAGNAVGELNSIKASAYPNPTNSNITIKAEDLKHITISNMLGQIIYDGSASGEVFEYDFGKHGAGLYLIRIETANGIALKKVSVER